MRLRIHHRTEYRYESPPALALQRLRLHPSDDAYARIVDWRVEVRGTTPQGTFTDGHGNRTELHALAHGSTAIAITVEGTAETRLAHGIVSAPRQGPDLWLYGRTTPLTRPTGGIPALAANVDGSVASLHALSERIRGAMRYAIGTTGAATTAAEALERGAGVCQDHAHAFCAAARWAGVPARYVSGYLRMDDRVEQDATHAWAEAHIRDLGWVAFDVSNGISPDQRYVALARGLDYRDAAPVSGIVRTVPGSETMRVTLRVETLPPSLQSLSQSQG